MIVKNMKHIVEVKCEPIDVTPLKERDPAWAYTDRKGHKHRWHIPHGADDWSKAHQWKLPTLREVTYICGYVDGEPMYDVHYYCKRCGELIKPGWKATVWRRFVQGAKSFYLDGVEVTEDVCRQLGILS